MLPLSSDGLINARPRQRFIWRSASVMIVFVFAITAWIAREPLLRGVAWLWIVSDPVTRADAIVILGGNFQLRPPVAAELYQKGLAEKILISQTGPSGADLSNTELNRAELLKLGVPASAIQTFGIANRSTRDEAISLKEWAKLNFDSDWLSSGSENRLVFIIPSEIASARRVKWIFHREFHGSSVVIQVPSFEVPDYTRTEWLKTQQGRIAFQNEFVKYIYYRLKY